MKISPIQVIASAAASVLAAVAASLFGEKGTIVGVALVSVIATVGSAAIAHSLRRGHEAVRQVLPAMRRPATGATEGRASAQPPGALPEHEEPRDHKAAREHEAVREQELRGRQTVQWRPRPSHAQARRRGFKEIFGVRWPVLAGAAAVVFVISMLVVTVIELSLGHTLANSVGGSNSSSRCTFFCGSGTPASTTTTTTTTTTVPRPTTTTPRTTVTTSPRPTTPSSTSTSTSTSTTTTTAPNATPPKPPASQRTSPTSTTAP